jgi:hypothetical protein
MAGVGYELREGGDGKGRAFDAGGCVEHALFGELEEVSLVRAERGGSWRGERFEVGWGSCVRIGARGGGSEWVGQGGRIEPGEGLGEGGGEERFLVGWWWGWASGVFAEGGGRRARGQRKLWVERDRVDGDHLVLVDGRVEIEVC